VNKFPVIFPVIFPVPKSGSLFFAEARVQGIAESVLPANVDSQSLVVGPKRVVGSIEGGLSCFRSAAKRFGVTASSAIPLAGSGG
jgi:hypothetical protein